jgi:hypothetical protein
VLLLRDDEHRVVLPFVLIEIADKLSGEAGSASGAATHCGSAWSTTGAQTSFADARRKRSEK